MQRGAGAEEHKEIFDSQRRAIMVMRAENMLMCSKSSRSATDKYTGVSSLSRIAPVCYIAIDKLAADSN